MQTKLTLRLDDYLIARAKSWAASNNISLSQAVATYFAQLTAEAIPHRKYKPWLQKLIGAAKVERQRPMSDNEIRRQHQEHIATKHG